MNRKTYEEIVRSAQENFERQVAAGQKIIDNAPSLEELEIRARLQRIEAENPRMSCFEIWFFTATIVMIMALFFLTASGVFNR